MMSGWGMRWWESRGSEKQTEDGENIKTTTQTQGNSLMVEQEGEIDLVIGTGRGRSIETP